MLSLSLKRKKGNYKFGLKKNTQLFRTMEYNNLRIYASETIELQVRILETVDADEQLKCLERAEVDQAQLWFSLDPMKVFPGWLY